ncbi:MAG: hypothetical protein JWP76_3581 [Dactylosporangium sp.]|jgi:hypothetical protein|nr:hypothetical protein [Dactylosporangium sp.]
MEHDEPAAEPTTVTTQAPTASSAAPPEPAMAGPSRLDMVGWAVRRISWRREKIAAEIERNRRGEPAVPTWLLAVLLVAILGALAAVVVLS